jgi:hypothetical protein
MRNLFSHLICSFAYNCNNGDTQNISRITVVALDSKLGILLWHYAEARFIPEGVVITKAYHSVSARVGSGHQRKR